MTAQLPSYDPKQFVNRQEEIEHILGIRDRLIAEGENAASQTVTISGEHGIGKSWLIQHLVYLCREAAQSSVLYLNLTDFITETHRLSDEKVAGSILAGLCQQLGYTEAVDQNLTDLSRQFIRTVKEKISTEPVLLLCDAIFETDHSLLAVLEEHLFAPFIINSRVMILFVGRSRFYSWSAPELRLKAEFRALPPFKPEETARQIAQQVPTQAAQAYQIHSLSHGHPKSNYLTAIGGIELATEGALSALLANLSDAEQPALREHLECMVVLQAFSASHLRGMNGLSHRQALVVINDLLRAGLIVYEADEGGYIMYHTVHQLLLTYMTERKRPILIDLHERAQAMYQTWTETYWQSQERWQERSTYHQNEIARLTSEEDSQ